MERTVRLTTTGLYDVHVPGGGLRGARCPVRLALHGYGGIRESMRARALPAIRRWPLERAGAGLGRA